MIVQRLGFGRYVVLSSDGVTEYTALISGACSCPFGVYNTNPARTCRHVREARLVHEEEKSCRPTSRVSCTATSRTA